MPKMSAEDRAKLEQMLKDDDEAEDDDDYEIEIYAPTGHGARLPYKRGKSYLATHFGIDADSLPKPDADPKSGKSSGTRKKADPESVSGDSDESSNTDLSFFQRRQQQRESAS